MARLSPEQQYDNLVRLGQEIGEHHREVRRHQAAIRKLTPRLIVNGHRLGLTNADLSRLVGEVSAESIRQEADKIPSAGPRAFKRRPHNTKVPQWRDTFTERPADGPDWSQRRNAA